MTAEWRVKILLPPPAEFVEKRAFRLPCSGILGYVTIFELRLVQVSVSHCLYCTVTTKNLSKVSNIGYEITKFYRGILFASL